jgi:hypothetical protein
VPDGRATVTVFDDHLADGDAVVERIFPLGEADEALRHLNEDRPFGKVVLAG